MKELMKELIYKNYQEVLNSNRINDLEKEVELNKKRLQKNLGKKQKNLLLRIGDAKDLKSEQCSYKSFIAGFKLGLKIGYETNRG